MPLKRVKRLRKYRKPVKATRHLIFERLEPLLMLAAPGAISFVDLLHGSDTGVSNTDNITLETEGLRFRWGSASGADGYYFGFGDPNPTANSTLSRGAILDAISEGANEFYVRGFNGDGLGPVANLTVFVDPNGPRISGLRLSEFDDSGYRNDDRITNEPDLRMLWRANTIAGIGIDAYYYGWSLDEVNSHQNVVPNRRTTTVVQPPGEGHHVFYVKAVANSGRSKITSKAINVDFSPPSSPTPRVDSVVNTSTTAIIWDYVAQTTWTTKVEVEVDNNGTWAPYISDGMPFPKAVDRSGRLSVSGLQAGQELRARTIAVDRAGNAGNPSDYTHFSVQAAPMSVDAPKIINTTLADFSNRARAFSVEFDQPIKESSFSNQDVSILDGARAINVNSVETLDDVGRRFIVRFEQQTTPSTYLVEIGADIEGLNGEPMNSPFSDHFTIVSKVIGAAADTDKDGLPDLWEEYGYTVVNGRVEIGPVTGREDQFVNLPAMGARKDIKDVFVEIDYLQSNEKTLRPNQEAINRVIAAFANAPLDNGQGITLHVDNGLDSPMSPGDDGTWDWMVDDGIIDDKMWRDMERISEKQLRSGQTVLSYGSRESLGKEIVTYQEKYRPHRQNAVPQENLAPGRDRSFHHAGFVDALFSGAGGFAVEADLVVHNSAVDDTTAVRFMHELGHTLGLLGPLHGDHWYPNNLSVMSYVYSPGLKGLRQVDAFGELGSQILDYSRYDDAELILDETQPMTEQGGFSVSSKFANFATRVYSDSSTLDGDGRDGVTYLGLNEDIDWNHNGIIDSVAVEDGDINGDGDSDDRFVPVNEWEILNYQLGNIGLEEVTSRSSRDNEGGPASDQAALVGQSFRSVTLDGLTRVLATPGSLQNISIDIVNTGTIDDSFAFALTLPENWTIETSVPNSVALVSGASATVVVTVRVPDEVFEGTTELLSARVSSTTGQAVDSIEMHFSIVREAGIHGVVFNDLDQNGWRDTSDTPAANVGVFIDTNNNGTVDGGELVATTDSVGHYSFENVSPGEQIVRLVDGSSLVQTSPAVGFKQLTENDVNDASNFDADGVNVVYQSDGHIFRTGGGVTIQLSPNDIPNRDPSISSGKTVWEGNFDIYYHDGESLRVFSEEGVSFSGPKIDGGRFVALGFVNGKNQVYLFDGQELSQITDGTVDELNPLIHGDKVVWKRGFGAGELYMYDISTATTTRIDGGHLAQSAPEGVHNGNVVWTGSDGTSLQIYKYSLSTNSVTQLSSLVQGAREPSIWNGLVAWRQFLPNGQGAVYYHDGTTTKPVPDSDNGIHITVGDQGIFWEDHDGNDWEIAQFDGTTTKTITNNAFDDQFPLNVGNQVVTWSQVDTDREIALNHLNDGQRVYLAPGSVATNVNFGVSLPGFSGVVFNDLDQNGWRDTSDTPAANVGVFIDTNNNGTVDGGELVATTDSVGHYSFENVSPGEQIVRLVDGSSLVQTSPAVGFKQLTENDVNDASNFDADGVNVVYQSDGHIFRTGGGVTIQLSPNDIPNRDPSISSGKTVWEGNFDIYYHDGESLRVFSEEGVSFSGPKIDGGRFVALGFVNGKNQVYLFDGQELSQITDGTVDELNPLIHGDKVVWKRGFGAGELYMYDISTATTTRIDGGHLAQSAPEGVHNGNVVWTGSDGTSLQIYKYSLSTNSVTQLSSLVQGAREPSIWNGLVAWRQFLPNGQGAVYYHDGTTTKPVPDSDNGIHITVGDQGIFWEDHDGNDWEIAQFDGTTTKTITNNAFDDQFPLNVGNQVVTWSQVDTDREIALNHLNDGQRFHLSADDSFDGASFGVFDENDAPIIEDAEFTTVENSPLETEVGQIYAADRDQNDELTYSIVSGDPSGVFSISGTGIVSVAKSIDFDSQSTYELSVRVQDDGSPALSDLAAIAIAVIDEDDEKPAIVNSSATVRKAESVTLVTSNLSAVDVDSDDSTLIFTMTSLPARGELKKDSVVLTLNTTFSQQDIADDRISYAHDGSNTTGDSFMFTVADPAGNETGAEMFSIMVPALTITLSSASVLESAGPNAATGTVTRSNSDIDAALTVFLESSDESEAELPPSVTIPAGAASAQFSVEAIDELLADEDEVVALTASASGYVDGTADITVLNNDLLIASPTAPTGTISDTTPTFTWEPVDGATNYELWVYHANTNTHKIVYETGLTETSYTPTSALPAGSYTFWVRAHAPDHVSIAWGARQFNIGAVLTAPALLTPNGNETDTTPTFTWNAVTDAATYELWVYSITTNTHQIIYHNDLTSNSYTPTAGEALPAGDYRFWVRAADSAGNQGPWSSSLDFSVGSVPAVPALTGPVGLTSDTTPTFSWQDVGADRYVLWVTESASGQRVIYETNLATNSFTPSAALNSGAHTFWVQAFNSTGQTNGWSARGDFTIGAVLPAPTILGPAGDTADTTPTFTWNAVATAVRYELSVYNQTTNTHNVIHEADLTGTSFTPSVAMASGHYQFWMRTQSSAGLWGDWSATTNFSIGVPGIPVLISPTVNTSDTTPTFSWNAATGAARYEISVYDATTNTHQVIHDANVTDTSYTSGTALTVGHTYRFWIRAIGENDLLGAWSDYLEFTII